MKELARITTVTIHAGTSFNHPHEAYANFKPGITLTAEIKPDDEDADQVILQLQGLAHRYVTEEKARIIQECDLKYCLDRVKDYEERRGEIIDRMARVLADPTEEVGSWDVKQAIVSLHDYRRQWEAIYSKLGDDVGLPPNASEDERLAEEWQALLVNRQVAPDYASALEECTTVARWLATSAGGEGGSEVRRMLDRWTNARNRWADLHEKHPIVVPPPPASLKEFQANAAAAEEVL